MTDHVYRVLVREPGGEWAPWAKRRRRVPRLYSRLGLARGAASQVRHENDYRERRGLAPLEFKVEQARTEWEEVPDVGA